MRPQLPGTFDFAQSLRRPDQKDTRVDRINGCCIHECQNCGNIWIPNRWVIEYCPECLSFNLIVKIEETNMPQDFSSLSTKGKPRVVSVGGKIIRFCETAGDPLIDVTKLPKIDCVASQLANINRFNGATMSSDGSEIYSYSVAQHSCMVADIVMAQASQWGRHLVLPALMHDVPEVVYGDITTGIKNSVGMALTSFLRDIDNLILNRYLGPLGYKYPLSEKDASKIKTADTFCLHFEAEILLPPGSRPSDDPDAWGAMPNESLVSDIADEVRNMSAGQFCWTREKARTEFLSRVAREVKYIKGQKK